MAAWFEPDLSLIGRLKAKKARNVTPLSDPKELLKERKKASKRRRGARWYYGKAGQEWNERNRARRSAYKLRLYYAKQGRTGPYPPEVRQRDARGRFRKVDP